MGSTATAAALGKITEAVVADTVGAEAEQQVQWQQVLPGQSISSILKENGFRNDHLGRVYSENLPLDQFPLIPGERFQKRWNRVSGLKELKFYIIPKRTSLTVWRQKDQAGATLRVENFMVKLRNFSGNAGFHLLGRIEAQADRSIANRFSDSFRLSGNWQELLNKSKHYQFVVEELFDNGTFIGFGDILETNLTTANEQHRRFFVAYPGGGAFINPDIQPAQRLFYSPVNYLRVSSAFNQRRRHPITKRRTPHLGVDLEMPSGEGVYAALDGIVVNVGRSRAAGKYIAIRHHHGFETSYNHLLSVNSNLAVGSPVAAGERIGSVGCTGYCTSPHLHFALKKEKRFVDPLPLLTVYPYHRKKYVGEKWLSLARGL